MELKALQGFMELLPAEQILFNQLLEAIQETYELFGFIPLDTPAIERAEILLAKSGGDTEKQIYRFQKGDSDLALRFDLTVPLARYVAVHNKELSFPFRRYHIGKVYRGERPQQGRYREFYQCDIDIIGDGQLSLINDAEIPSVIYAVFRRLGFEEFTIRINNRKILTGFFSSLGIVGEPQTEVLRVIDKLEKIGLDATKEELVILNIPAESISKIFAFLGIAGKNEEIIDQLNKLGVDSDEFRVGVDELDAVVKAICRFGVPDKNTAIDLKIARGLDYYTGTIYETILNDYPELGSVCSGGRFDNLAECYIDKRLPGVGISIGLTRLFSKLLEKGVIKPSNSTPAKVLVIPLDNQLDKAIEVSTTLRQNNIPTAVYLEQAKPSRIFKHADRLQIPYVVIIGENEITQGKVSLKDMKTGVQVLKTVEEVANTINSR